MRLDVCLVGGGWMYWLCVKGKGEVAFGEVTGRVSGVERGRAREGVALLLSEWMENKVVEWKEVSSRSRSVQIFRLSYSCKWWSRSRCAS